MDYEKTKQGIASYIDSLVSQGKFHVIDEPQKSRAYSVEITQLCAAIKTLDEAEQIACYRPAPAKE